MDRDIMEIDYFDYQNKIANQWMKGVVVGIIIGSVITWFIL